MALELVSAAAVLREHPWLCVRLHQQTREIRHKNEEKTAENIWNGRNNGMAGNPRPRKKIYKQMQPNAPSGGSRKMSPNSKGFSPACLTWLSLAFGNGGRAETTRDRRGTLSALRSRVEPARWGLFRQAGRQACVCRQAGSLSVSLARARYATKKMATVVARTTRGIARSPVRAKRA